MAGWLQRLTKPSITNAPPQPREQLRNDLAVLGVILFALFLGFGLRSQAFGASRSLELPADLGRLLYPAAWTVRAAPDLLVRVFDAGSPGTFDTRLEVAARPLRPQETLAEGRADLAFKRIAALPAYRELAVDEAEVKRGAPALVVTYSYLADPAHESGIVDLPVVVEAQDIVYVDDGQLVVVTMAADANEWNAEEHDLAVIRNGLRLRPRAASLAPAVEPQATGGEQPAATPASGFGGAQGEGGD
jgi:hypothetical protein